MKGFSGVTIKVLLKIGSKYEKKGEYGISHFLEHMAFKGTTKRPKPGDVAGEIEAKGAMHNAETDVEVTSYYITTIKKNIDWALELLSDVLLNSLYDEKEIAKERGVIAEEIRMYDDNPMIGFADDMAQFMFGTSKIGRFDVSGRVADVMSLNRQKLMSYREKYFESKRMVIVLAGDVDKDAFGMVEKYFGGIKTEKSVDLPKIELRLSGKKLWLRKKEMAQAHFCVAVPGVAWKDKRMYTQDLLEVILAGNCSSRLFKKIREERGWAYYVSSAGQMYEEGGLLAVQSGVKISKIDEARQLVVEEMLGLTESLKREELTSAREYVLGKLKLAMDRTSFWANYIGRKMLLESKMANMEEEIRRYREVSLEMAQELAKNLFCVNYIKEIVVKRA
jgi:predicted Zn-dependent peptidase